ncbi:MAG: hypothetical protein ACI3WQ_02835 [Faecousia sp.]
MRNLRFEYVSCDDIIAFFGEEKVQKRFDSLYMAMEAFLEQNELQDKVVINRMLLSTAIIDYFNDIKRIKDFHSQIEKTNSEKVIAYTSYWLLQRSPLQVRGEDVINDRRLATLNERFVLQYICNYLSVRKRGDHIFSRQNEGLKNFSKLLLYYLIYRLHNAQSLEMVISAFMAGQIYERTDKDISDELHPYDTDVD